MARLYFEERDIQTDPDLEPNPWVNVTGGNSTRVEVKDNPNSSKTTTRHVFSNTNASKGRLTGLVNSLRNGKELRELYYGHAELEGEVNISCEVNHYQKQNNALTLREDTFARRFSNLDDTIPDGNGKTARQREADRIDLTLKVT